MKRIVKTEGICLYARRYRETSKIVTFYTKDFGKITLLARGARRPNSKFGAALEVFTLDRLIFYNQPERLKRQILRILADTEILNPFLVLRESAERVFWAAKVLRFIIKTTEYSLGEPKLYFELKKTLRYLSITKDPKSEFYQFLLSSLSILGYKMRLRTCLCGAESGMYFSIKSGGALCFRCARTRRFSDTIRLIPTPGLSNPENESWFISSQRGQQLINRYIEYHLGISLY